MADSALTPDPLERYGAIERAYCDERWMAVVHDGQTLLSDLAQSEETPPEGLKERLQLLVGHAYLYGLGDRDSAEDYYQAVLRSGAEASLRQIAEQGLQQCGLPVGPAEVVPEREPGDSASGPDPAASSASAARQEDAAWGSPAEPAIPASVDSPPAPEPDRAPQQQVADSWGTAASQPSSEPTETLGWLTAARPAVPPPAAGQPVMPWLESGASPAALSTGLSQPEPAVEAEDIAASRRQLEPEAGPLPLQPAETSSPFAAAPAEEVTPAAAAESSLEPATPAGDAEPPFNPETVASLAATAAAVAAALEQSGNGSQPQPLQEVSEASSQGSVDVAGFSQMAAADDDQPAAELAISAPPAAVAERLEADVVEEPELIELHQASQRPQDDILLETADVLPVQPSAAALQASIDSGARTEAASAAEPAPLDRRQDRRGTDADWPEVQEDLIEPAAEPAPVEVAEPVVAASTLQTATRLGPFSAPPVPVAEEDPELLMGLLKVEMG